MTRRTRADTAADRDRLLDVLDRDAWLDGPTAARRAQVTATCAFHALRDLHAEGVLEKQFTQPKKGGGRPMHLFRLSVRHRVTA